VKRALLAAIGLAATVYAGLHLVGVPAGFPDGYVSPYDLATLIWVTIGTYALLVFGLFTLVAAGMQKLGRASVGAVICIVLGLWLWVADGCTRMPWCVPVLEQLGLPIDDGQGG
jgi:hypothetical protein